MTWQVRENTGLFGINGHECRIVCDGCGFAADWLPMAAQHADVIPLDWTRGAGNPWKQYFCPGCSEKRRAHQ